MATQVPYMEPTPLILLVLRTFSYLYHIITIRFRNKTVFKTIETCFDCFKNARAESEILHKDYRFLECPFFRVSLISF